MAETPKPQCLDCELENIYWSLLDLIMKLRYERAKPHIEEGTLIFTLPDRGTIRAKFYGRAVE